MMRRFTLALLAINVVTFGWLILGASMELPPWEQAFKDAKVEVNNFDHRDELADMNREVLSMRIDTAEQFSRMTIEEYKRSDGPLAVLTIINILGFAVLALRNRKGQQAEDGDTSQRPC